MRLKSCSYSVLRYYSTVTQSAVARPFSPAHQTSLAQLGLFSGVSQNVRVGIPELVLNMLGLFLCLIFIDISFDVLSYY